MQPLPNLDLVLARHGVSMDADEFWSILTEAVESTDTLTADEQLFLADHGGLLPETDPVNQTAARQRLAIAAARADAEAVGDGYTTTEVAKRFGLAPSNIRRAALRRSLYVAGRTRRREHVFPRWQFTAEGPLPGLREVLAALPEGVHPLDVATFMTTSNDALGERSPVEWLAGGGAPGRAAQAADELART